MQMCLVASGEAISSVLTLDRDKKQLRIHFVSRALQGPALNYQILEKLVHALIYAATRLRRYYQAHKIDVPTRYSIKQILLRLEKLRHLAKWAIELGEHDIDYRSHISIKAQALVDFLVKIPDTLKNVLAVLLINPVEP